MGYSICDKIKEFFEYINCISSCCNKTIVIEKKHHKHHTHVAKVDHEVDKVDHKVDKVDHEEKKETH